MTRLCRKCATLPRNQTDGRTDGRRNKERNRFPSRTHGQHTGDDWCCGKALASERRLYRRGVQKPTGHRACELSRRSKALSLSRMCGRFGASFQYREIKAFWNLRGDFPTFFPRYNIAPSQDVPVIVRNEDRNEIKPMHWGLVQSWAQDPSVGQRMINARSETLLEKPSFKNLVASRRCLVPADGFYEWRREGNRKVPMWIHLKSRVPFAFAGLWDYWRDLVGDKELYSFTIITTEANALLRPIHNRMPVIYDKEMGRQWLEESFGDQPMILAAVLRPWPSELMEAHDVSTLVNSPENDTAECIQSISPGQPSKSQLPLL